VSKPTSRPMLPIYFGPALPRWQPRTIEDVQTAIDNGTMRETVSPRRSTRSPAHGATHLSTSSAIPWSRRPEPMARAAVSC
jgi:hypothetical protein